MLPKLTTRMGDWLARLRRTGPAVPVPPDLAIERIASLAELERLTRDTAAALGRQRATEHALLVESAGRSTLRVPAYCAVCDRASPLLVDFEHAAAPIAGEPRVPNWRERLVCPRCGLNNRMRAAIQLFEQIAEPGRDATIYVTEQVTPLYRAIRERHPDTAGSEYLGAQCPLGETVRGIRNEDLTSLTFADARFDAILSFDVLEHVPDTSAALREMHRCLKPGGTLLLGVPFVASSQKTLVRARRLEDGRIEHMLPPEYHGDPLQRSAGCLCFYHFGWDLLDAMRAVGYSDPGALLYWSRHFGYLGAGQLLFVASR